MNGLKFLAMCVLSTGLAFSSINNAEAAKVALLPLVNNVVDREDLNQIYYDRALEATKLNEIHEVVDSKELDVAIEKNVKLGELPDKAACEAIAEQGSVDLVIMMKVDELNYYKKSTGLNCDDIILNLQGRLVAYDAIQGKYINKTIKEQDEVKDSLMARYDPQGEQFAKCVTREVKRLLNIKKVTIERPRITGHGLKGDRR